MMEKNITKTKIAAVQMASGPNVSFNLIEAARLILLAAKAGAKLVVLPENFVIMGMNEHEKVAIREPLGKGPIQDFLRDQARKNKVWLVGGTIPLEANDPNKVRAACLLFDDQGNRVAHYDKIHLFDVNITETNDQYWESETIEAGENLVVADTPFGKMGLAVCYDLRFPEMYRNMVDQGVELIVLPSAFTATTGRVHWEVLVRARAIENLSYVIASNQGGYHINGRETFGDSMIVDPWGRVMDRLVRGSGFVIAEYNRGIISEVRKNFPALSHRRLNCSV